MENLTNNSNNLSHTLLDDDLKLAYGDNRYAYGTLVIINSFLHAVGFTLLLLTWRKKKTPQHFYLINLALLECWHSICMTVITFCGPQYGIEDSTSLWMLILMAIVFTFNNYMYISILSVITADRLLAAIFHMRYKAVCTLHRTKILMGVIWIVCLGLSGTILTYNYTVKGMFWLKKDRKIYEEYVQMGFFSVYLIFLTIAYTTMFAFYVRSRRSSSTDSSDTNLSTFRLFRRSKFHTSVLLVSSFLVFLLIPTMIITITNRKLPTVVLGMLYFSMSLSDTVDFFIYVFIYRPVFDFLRKTMTS